MICGRQQKMANIFFLSFFHKVLVKFIEIQFKYLHGYVNCGKVEEYHRVSCCQKQKEKKSLYDNSLKLVFTHSKFQLHFDENRMFYRLQDGKLGMKY